MEIGNELLVKRLQRLDARRLLLKSANPAYEPVTVDLAAEPHVKITGRVVWLARAV